MASQAEAPSAPQHTEEPPEPHQQRGGHKVWDFGYKYTVLWALLIEIAIFSVLKPDSFFTLANAQSILGSQATALILALGLTVALAVNEFDLSIAAVMGFAQVLVGTLTVNSGWPLGLAIVATLGACGTVGLLNALLVVRIGVGAFIATLGVGTFLTGIVVKITASEPIANLPSTLTTISDTRLLGLQLVFWYGLAATALVWYILARTPLGRRLYFTGSNPNAARLNGVRTGVLRGGALVVSGLAAGVAGILYAGVFGTADPNSGNAFLLPAFAAAFLGATAVTPGRFNAWGTFIAVYLVSTGIVGLSLVTAEVGWISFVFNGAVLVIAVVAQRVVAVTRTRQQHSS